MFSWKLILTNIITTTVVIVSIVLITFLYREDVSQFFIDIYLEDIKNEVVDSDVESDILVTDHEKNIINSVEKANPAVVSIMSIKSSVVDEGLFWEDIILDDPNRSRDEDMVGGSGFIVSESGYVVTNRHVVEDDDIEYSVLTNDGERYEAEVLDRDSFFDIAILKIESSDDLKHLEFGNSDLIRVGQTAIAIGNDLGEFANSVSVGVVSGLSRSITAGDGRGSMVFFDEVIQTDAAINPGNSGGPLMDIKGKVIGVNSALAVGSQNIGFAVPSNIVKPIVSSVEDEGRIIRPFLGIRYVEINSSLKMQKNLPVDYGILLVEGRSDEPAVSPGTPAEEVGLKKGDIITEVDGEEIKERRDFAKRIRYKEVGETIELKVLRDEEEFLVEVSLIEAPEGI